MNPLSALTSYKYSTTSNTVPMSNSTFFLFTIGHSASCIAFQLNVASLNHCRDILDCRFSDKCTYSTENCFRANRISLAVVEPTKISNGTEEISFHAAGVTLSKGFSQYPVFMLSHVNISFIRNLDIPLW